jgi:hypothetical protein
MRTPPLLGLFVLFAAGCSATKLYPGPERPASETSVIHAILRVDSRGWPGDESYDVRMVRVDDHEFDDYERAVEVLPGRHEVHLVWERWVFFWPPGFYLSTDGDSPYRELTDSGLRIMEIQTKPGVEHRLIVPWDDSGKDWYFEEKARR